MMIMLAEQKEDIKPFTNSHGERSLSLMDSYTKAVRNISCVKEESKISAKLWANNSSD